MLIAQLRLEARFADGFLHAPAGEAVRGAGRADYVFFNHNASEIVGTRVQAELCYIFSHGEPTGLYVDDIWQHDTAERDHADVFLRCSEVMYATDFCEQGVHILESPGDECEETLGISRFAALHFADFHQVLKTVLQGFYMAEHHGG